MYVPLSLGSGGGGTSAVAGGTGGGAIRLNVKDQLVVNGIISSNGLVGGYRSWGHGAYDYGGGGSGGSIWISAGTFTGTGSIQAVGGSGGGGGGGGRIALYTSDCLASSSNILFSVIGGAGSIGAGTAGTNHCADLPDLYSTLTISPAKPVAGQTNAATVTVTLKNADGTPVSGQAVKIAIALGSGLYITGNPNIVGMDQYVSIGNTNSSGIVSVPL
ncbi:hypothetical protein JZU71_02935, partial [bacterium]|nr:hypothetical protein [bacterium]